jgi:glycosyltransferase involved in cell wall biosynthesis
LRFVRIGFFTECYRPIVNGVVTSIDAMRRGLHAHGAQTICITPAMPHYEDDDDAIVRIPSLPLPTSSGYRLTVPLSSATLRKRIGTLDIVHAHSPFITGNIALRYARALGVPLVFTYHTRLDFYAHYVPFERVLTQRALAAWTRGFANAAAAVVVPGSETRRYLQSIGVRAPIEVVPSPIDTAAFAAGVRRPELRARLGADEGTRLVLIVGRLAREKNVRLGLEAFARAPEAMRLAVAGEGPERAALERHAARLGIAGRTAFLGRVAPREMPDLYASADVLLFPSRSETQGLVLAEALVAGLPAVAVASPPSEEVLGPGATVAPDPVALGREIEARGGSRLDQSAIQLASLRFSLEEQARRLLDVYGLTRTHVRY